MNLLPEEFTKRMKALLLDEYEEFALAIADKSRSASGLRANTLKISPDELEKILDINLQKTKWCDCGFHYDENERPAKSPLFQAGLYYIQEPSAMIPASILPIETGDRVLDVCAAPGGKTTHLASKLNDTGIIVANDVSGGRCIALNKNIDLMGIKNAVVTNEEPSKLKGNFENWFDKILIDAPCSGEGMFRKDNSAVSGWLEHSPESCAILQKDILENSAIMLKNGGIMVYSTCTFNPNENELMIQQFLNGHDDFEIVPIDHKRFGLETGRMDWAGNDERLLSCGRIWPHKNDGEGHFVALLQKKGDYIESLNNAKNKINEKKIEGIEYYESWCEKHLNVVLRGNIARRKDALYLEPYDMPNLHGIHSYKTGLYLGDMKLRRFEPSTAFALALKKHEFKNAVDFDLKEQEVSRYLNGESFDVDSVEGYNLFCVNGYSLGFGKVVNGRLKNRRM